MNPRGERELELALVEQQARIVTTRSRVLVIVEGTDGAGKTTLIRRATRNLDPRHCRVVSMKAPTEIERAQWYFQRWIPHLPAASEIVFFDRSWYNRAAIEPVLGWCTPDERAAFLDAVPRLERLLVDDGIQLIKLFLDVHPDVQLRRLAERAADPLQQWKNSVSDRAAKTHGPAMRAAHAHMIARTPPWVVIDNNDDGRTGLDALRALVNAMEVCDGGDAISASG